MTPANVQKCAHPVCSCMATSGKYCSIACETMEQMPDIDCHCGHAVCNGETDHPAASQSDRPS
jgi:hypothetical protein